MVTDTFGNEVVLAPSSDDIKVLEEIKLLPIDVQEYEIQDVLSKTFYNQGEITHQSSRTIGYWGKCTIVNNNKEEKWVVNFPIMWTDVTAYIINQNGERQEGRTGQFIPIKERSFSPQLKANIVQFIIPRGEKATLYFKAVSKRKYITPRFDLSISTSECYYNNLHASRFNLGIFIGFMLMMLIYNLFLYYFTAKDKAYLFYSIYILGIILYSAYNTGDLASITHSLFLPDFPKYTYLAKTSTFLVIYAYLNFLRSFLHTEENLPKWDKAITILLWSNLCFFIADVTLMLTTNFNSDISDIATVGNALLFILFLFTFCIALIRTDIKSRVFILAGMAFMATGSVMTAVARIQGVDYSTTPLQVGTIIEVIIFSLGLAFRRRYIEREKQNALFTLEKSELRRSQEQKESERLKELDILKTKLYTNITHEFRTPLMIINGNLEFIEDHPLEKSIIRRNSNQMLRLINQVLDISKLEANLLDLNLIQGDIVKYLQYVVESIQSLAGASKIHLTFQSKENSIMMDFDKEKMEHIVYNLISNAVKFTPSGGSIKFHLQKEMYHDALYLQLKIADTGCGISSEELPYIFDRFHKLNSSSIIGTGIGLAFVRELTEMLGGDITVISEEGVGSEFKVLLPITRNAELWKRSTLPTPSERSLPQESIVNVEDREVKKEGLPILLLIEDNLDVVSYIVRLLEKKYQIHTAHDGKAGCEIAASLIPDVIISDVMMPKMDGYQVTQFLKENQNTSHIPIILLTAKATQKDKMNGLISGADSYLNKPFHQDELLVRLSNIDRQQKVLIEKFQSGFFNANPLASEKDLVFDENPFLRSIRNLLLAEISNPDFGVIEIGSELGLSKDQFYRKIKALTGTSPTRFIRSIRLKEALELMKNNNLNISEIAYRVGFKDPNYFTRLFHNEFGASPRTYFKTEKNM